MELILQMIKALFRGVEAKINSANSAIAKTNNTVKTMSKDLQDTTKVAKQAMQAANQVKSQSKIWYVDFFKDITNGFSNSMGTVNVGVNANCYITDCATGSPVPMEEIFNVLDDVNNIVQMYAIFHFKDMGSNSVVAHKVPVMQWNYSVDDNGNEQWKMYGTFVCQPSEGQLFTNLFEMWYENGQTWLATARVSTMWDNV